MAKVTNSFTTYDAQANREDLSDIIYNIDPFDTPMMTAVGRRNVDNVTFDWQTESLPAVSTTVLASSLRPSRVYAPLTLPPLSNSVATVP